MTSEILIQNSTHVISDLIFTILHDFLPPELADEAFENLRREVKWNTMMHRGVCTRCIDEGVLTRCRRRGSETCSGRGTSLRGREVREPNAPVTEHRVLTSTSFPIYRHPADESPPLLPFSLTVARIQQHVEKVLREPVNHVLIQHYRSGADYISEHSDKTIDVNHPPHEFRNHEDEVIFNLCRCSFGNTFALTLLPLYLFSLHCHLDGIYAPT